MIKKLITNDYLLFFAVTMLVNAGNYGLNLFLGRFLGPEYFAEANVLATLVLMISFIGVAFQLTTAKFIAKEKDTVEDLTDNLLVVARRIGILFTLILIICSSVLQTYLNFQSVIPLIILFIAFPFFIVMSVERGILQGKGNFKSLGATYLAEMFGRLIVTVALVYILSHQSITLFSEAISIGFAISFVLSHLAARTKTKHSIFARITLAKPIVSFFVIILLYELCQIFINNSDVILVKHFFDNQESGLYNALALIGRIVFFATWIMVTLLFPKVVKLKEEGKDTSNLFLASLGGVGAVALTIVILCYFQGTFIISTLFGKEYASIGSSLWLYALATSLFSCANVFVYYHLSLSNYLPVAISLVAGVFQVVGIYLYHESLVQVIEVQIFTTALLFASLMIYHNSHQKVAELIEATKHAFLPSASLKKQL